ncbi:MULTISPECIES: PaaI family thioesterase [Burkholderia]|uniref:PaaI family thioesterase n=1 Tax=Burkholderia contaminans TaxID=488447 RepID=A0A3N8R954_9BURK|nr:MULTISPECIES: PaaI family thioesterase [Burkholderia]RQT14863.1 PaaI family thioesterase [Burkholderia contaminans]TGN98694.1 PaaI family thioesterase [Burkholderia sp. USMB20]
MSDPLPNTEFRDHAGIPDNPDRALLHALLSTQARNIKLDMNPALTSLGATLLAGSAGVLSIGFTAPEHSVQGNGVVAGGTLASMLDFAMALALLSELPHGRTCATISLTVNMLEPGHVGEFVANARVKRRGGRVAFAGGELYDATRTRCIATATAPFAVFDVRR